MFAAHTEADGARRGKHGRQSDASLKFWTNVGLLTAVIIGMLVVVFHGGNQTTGIAWAGAGLALGGLLGFLFGIPGRSQGSVQINQPGVAAVGTDIGKAVGKGELP